ncbi:MAG: class I SAM-dependent methyltransferase [Planctomycetota bacterium]|nr:class I SAM-dependent methyltransferase [Planctomycetota bacterium]
MSTDRVRAIFDDWAERGRAEGMEYGHAFAARMGFRALELAAGQRYLDVGCGNGYTVRWAAPLVAEAIGLDLSPAMVARARAASTDFEQVAFHEAAFPVHELEPASFHGVFSMEVLYYLPDVDAALRAIHDLLVPGGRFACVVDYYRENEASHSWPDDLGCPMTLLSMTGWRGAFQGADLEVLDQQCIQQPLLPGESPGWKHAQGSLLTLGRRRE